MSSENLLVIFVNAVCHMVSYQCSMLDKLLQVITKQQVLGHQLWAKNILHYCQVKRADHERLAY